MLKRVKYSAVIIALFLLLFACSTVDEYSSETLANQGILPLSSTNPYLGTNLYIARQAEKSRLLYHFLDRRGAPAAIELIDRKFKKPRMLLYYPQAHEVYSAELEKQGDTFQWIVRGPFGIKRPDYLTISRLQALSKSDPVFIVAGRQKRFKIDRELALATPTPLPTSTPLPRPTLKPTPRKVKPKPTAKIITSPSVPAPSIKDFKPLNADQQAIQMAKGYAERADNGDVIHTVKKDSESIEQIAKWYTGAENNSDQIRKANNIEEGKTLVKGQRIRVPINLLKELKAMP